MRLHELNQPRLVWQKWLAKKRLAHIQVQTQKRTAKIQRNIFHLMSLNHKTFFCSPSEVDFECLWHLLSQEKKKRLGFVFPGGFESSCLTKAMYSEEQKMFRHPVKQLGDNQRAYYTSGQDVIWHLSKKKIPSPSVSQTIEQRVSDNVTVTRQHIWQQSEQVTSHLPLACS